MQLNPVNRCRIARGVAATVVLAGALAAPAQTSAPAAAVPASDPARDLLTLAEIAPAPPIAAAAETPLSADPALEARFAAALEAFEAGRHAVALAELSGALQQMPGPVFDVYYLLARTRFALGQFGEARLAAERAAVVRPEAAEVHLLLGRVHRHADRRAAALAALRRATLAGEAGAARTRAWYELAVELEQSGARAAAAEAYGEFERALAAAPAQRTDPELAPLLEEAPHGAIERRVALLRALDRTADAVQAARQAHEAAAADPVLERLYARTLLETGRPAEAFAFARARLAGAADEAPALLSLAVEAGRATGGLTAWVDELAAGIARGERPAYVRALIARLGESGAAALAVPLWRALAAAEPDQLEVTWALAGALRDSGDLRGAIEALVGFVRENEAAADISADRLAAWMRSYKAADEFLTLVQEYRAGRLDFAAATVLGMTAAAAGQPELAERLFAAALEDRPEFLLARLAWGRMLLQQFRWEAALAQADQALAVAPRSAGASAIRAEALTGLDRYDEAEQALKHVVEERPDDAAAVLALARHYRRTGNTLAAQRYLQEAWSLTPRSAVALEELVESYLEAGKVEIARGALQNAAAADVPEDVLRRMRTNLQFANAPMQAEHLAELQRQFAAHPEDVTTGLKLAAGLYLNQRAAEARAVLEQVQARAPEDERLLHLLARVHLRLLEREAAIALLARLSERYPRRLAVLRQLVDAYLADFRFPEARQTLERMLALEIPADQRNALRSALVTTHTEVRDFAAALALLEQWSAAEPEEPAWPNMRLRILLDAERPEDAIALATQRLEPVTARYQTLRSSYQELAETAETPEARARLEKLERDLAAERAALLEQRREFVATLVEARRFDAAEARVRGWLADDPDQPAIQELLVTVLLAARKPDAALEAIAALVPTTPADVIHVLGWRAHAYAQRDQVDEALDDLTGLLQEQFIRENPAVQAELRQDIVRLLVEAGAFDRARELVDRWLAEVPAGDRLGRLGALLLKRSVLVADGRLEEQIPIAEELLAAQPHDPALNNDLGYTLVERGAQLARARAMIELAVAAEPLNAAYLDSLGWVYYKEGDFARARLHLERAVKLRAGQDATVYDHLGDAAQRLSDAAAARQAWEQALALAGAANADAAAARDAELLAAVRAKLAALAAGEKPAVAPTAAEEAAEESTQP